MYGHGKLLCLSVQLQSDTFCMLLQALGILHLCHRGNADPSLAPLLLSQDLGQIVT